MRNENQIQSTTDSQKAISKMPVMEVKNETIENYIYWIFIKMAILLAFKVISIAGKVHASYRKSLKKRYDAKNVEAPKPSSQRQNP